MIPAKYRKTVYIVALVALSAAFVAGILTPEQVDGWVDAAVKAAGIASALLAALNVTPDVDEWHH
jgi:hypothetical protein